MIKLNTNTLLLIITLLLLGSFIYHLIFIPKCYDSFKKIRILHRQAARWAMAALQDESELIRTLHANYATGYLWALKDIASESEFKIATLTDLSKFEETIVKIQNDATKKLVLKCSALTDNQLNINKTILDVVYKTAT